MKDAKEVIEKFELVEDPSEAFEKSPHQKGWIYVEMKSNSILRLWKRKEQVLSGCVYSVASDYFNRDKDGYASYNKNWFDNPSVILEYSTYDYRSGFEIYLDFDKSYKVVPWGDIKVSVDVRGQATVGKVSRYFYIDVASKS